MKYRIIFQGISGGWQLDTKEYDTLEDARNGVEKYIKAGYEKRNVLVINIIE